MKKLAIATLGLAVLSTSAFASKARLEALGQDANGSQWIDDQRNVFLNPAHLNTHYDWMTLEWGNTSAASDDADSPRAEGGMFKNAGNMIYGLYLGAESNTSNALRRAAGLDTLNGAHDEQNNLDLFVGGDAGVQWGVRLTHSAFDDGGDNNNTAQRLTVGVVSGDIDAFLNFGLANTAEDGTNEFTGNGSMDLGVTYGMGDMDIMLRHSTITAENENGSTTTEFTSAKTQLGVAKTYKLNDKATAYASAFYVTESSECDFSACTNVLGSALGADEFERTSLPVTIGMEVMAKDWLMFRGSVGQNVLIGSQTVGANGDEASVTNTTIVNAGASLIYGDFQIDGLIGNNDTGDGAPGNNTVGDTSNDATANGNGILRTDALMSRVSMTYKF